MTNVVSKNKMSAGSLVIAALVGEYALLLMPFILLALTSMNGVSENTALNLISAQLFGMAFGSIVTSIIVTRLQPKVTIGLASIAIFITNALCAGDPSVLMLAIYRIVTGLAEGTLLAMACAIIGALPKAHKIFSALGFAVAFFAAFFLFYVPVGVEHFGAHTIFWFLALVPLLVLPLLKWLPNLSQIESTHYDFGAIFNLQTLSLLLAYGALWIGAGSLWIFAEKIGAHHGLGLKQIGGWLAVAQVIGLGGPILAGKFGLTVGLRTSLVVSCIFMIIGGALFVLSPVGYMYGIGAAFLSFFIMFMPPCFRSLMANMDDTGKIVALSVGLYSISFAVAPIFIGLINTNADYTGVFWLSTLCFAACLILVVISGKPKQQ